METFLTLVFAHPVFSCIALIIIFLGVCDVINVFKGKKTTIQKIEDELKE